MSTLRMFLPLPLAIYVAITGLPLIEPAVDSFATLFGVQTSFKGHSAAVAVARMVAISGTSNPSSFVSLSEAAFIAGWIKSYGPDSVVPSCIVWSCLGICAMTLITPFVLFRQYHDKLDIKRTDDLLLTWAQLLTWTALSVGYGGSEVSMELKGVTAYAWCMYCFVLVDGKSRLLVGEAAKSDTDNDKSALNDNRTKANLASNNNGGTCGTCQDNCEEECVHKGQECFGGDSQCPDCLFDGRGHLRHQCANCGVRRAGSRTRNATPPPRAHKERTR